MLSYIFQGSCNNVNHCKKLTNYKQVFVFHAEPNHSKRQPTKKCYTDLSCMNSILVCISSSKKIMCYCISRVPTN